MGLQMALMLMGEERSDIPEGLSKSPGIARAAYGGFACCLSIGDGIGTVRNGSPNSSSVYLCAVVEGDTVAWDAASLSERAL